MSGKKDPAELPPAVVAYLQGLVADKFFGSVTLTFQGGKVLQVRNEQVHKVDELGQEKR